MPVFDFNNSPTEAREPECTYEVFYSSNPQASAEQPILVLENGAGELKHHTNGVFTNPIKRTAFEFKGETGTVSADILRIDARFVSLLKWLGENHIHVRLSGQTGRRDMRCTRSGRLHLGAARSFPQRMAFCSL